MSNEISFKLFRILKDMTCISKKMTYILQKMTVTPVDNFVESVDLFSFYSLIPHPNIADLQFCIIKKMYDTGKVNIVM